MGRHRPRTCMPALTWWWRIMSCTMCLICTARCPPSSALWIPPASSSLPWRGGPIPRPNSCLRCFDLIGKPYPFHTSEDWRDRSGWPGRSLLYGGCPLRVSLSRCLDENRLSMGRFLMGDDFHAVPRRAMLQCFDPYAHAGQITMQLVHKHIILRRQVQGRELLEARAQAVAQSGLAPQGARQFLAVCSSRSRSESAHVVTHILNPRTIRGTQ